jgi:phage anti-repressor protein
MDAPQDMRYDKISKIMTEDAFLQKLAEEFTTEDQQMFVDSFTVHMAHDPGAFVVDLDDAVIWLGFARRDHALRAVRTKLVVDFDFQLSPHVGGNQPGRQKERYMLTVGAFKQLCMLAGTAKGATVRRYFVKLERVVMDYILAAHAAPATPDEASLLEASRNVRRRCISDGVASHTSVDRVSVHMVADELVRSGRIHKSTARDNFRLTRAGAVIAKLFKGREDSGEVTMVKEGTGYELAWSGEDPVRIADVTAEIASKCRMRHIIAYGLQEVHAGTVYNPWTYPAAFKLDMELALCAEFGIPGVMRAAVARTSPWG